MPWKVRADPPFENCAAVGGGRHGDERTLVVHPQDGGCEQCQPQWVTPLASETGKVLEEEFEGSLPSLPWGRRQTGWKKRDPKVWVSYSLLGLGGHLWCNWMFAGRQLDAQILHPRWASSSLGYWSALSLHVLSLSQFRWGSRVEWVHLVRQWEDHSRITCNLVAKVAS